MADETNTTEPTPAAAEPLSAAPSKEGAEPATASPVLTDDVPPAAIGVDQPLGTEFSLTVHEGIAARLGAEIKDVCYAIETDVKNGVHRLKGWLKIA